MKFLSLLKKNLVAFSAATVGLFHFLLLALPFGGDFARSGGRKNVFLISGYRSMGQDVAYLDAGGLAVFAQIVTLLAAISLLLLGAYLIAKIFLPQSSNLPEGFGGMTFRKLCGYGLVGYAGCCLLVLLTSLIVSIANSGSTTAFDQVVHYGFSMGIGPILAVLLSSGNVFALWFLNQKGLTADHTPNFCAFCGEKLSLGAVYCSACGAKVETEVTYACSHCGLPSDADSAFCSQCGGRIVKS